MQLLNKATWNAYLCWFTEFSYVESRWHLPVRYESLIVRISISCRAFATTLILHTNSDRSFRVLLLCSLSAFPNIRLRSRRVVATLGSRPVSVHQLRVCGSILNFTTYSIPLCALSVCTSNLSFLFKACLESLSLSVLKVPFVLEARRHGIDILDAYDDDANLLKARGCLIDEGQIVERVVTSRMRVGNTDDSEAITRGWCDCR